MSSAALAVSNEIENVYLFVSDALRWSALPESVRTRGLTFKTVASGTATMKSFSSLLTGVYPPAHGVRTWRDRLTRETLFDIPGLSTGFLDAAAGERGGLSQVLDQESRDTLDEISPPFFFLERDQGGHAPYRSYTYEEMLREVEQSRSALQSYYQEAVQESIKRFDDRLRLLSERGLLDDTLVVFLSDHGELLGEYGLVSHSSPLVPELVYVPTVFIHPSIPNESSSETIGHVDIAPTVRSILGTENPKDTFNGVDLSSEAPDARFCEATHVYSSSNRRITMFYAAGIWDGDGGHVFNKRGKLIFPVICYRKANGWNREFWKANPQSIPTAVGRYVRPHLQYGEPGVSKHEAAETVEIVRDVSDEAEQMKLDDDVQQRLKDLGYRT